jgi:hypothetical protein
MHQGATAEEAVRAAIALNRDTGGEVQTLNLKEHFPS